MRRDGSCRGGLETGNSVLRADMRPCPERCVQRRDTAVVYQEIGAQERT